MNSEQILVLIDGKDRTDEIESVTQTDRSCQIRYCNSPKTYSYNKEKVKIFKIEKKIDPDAVVIDVKGRRITEIKDICKFPFHYKIIFNNLKRILYPEDVVHIAANSLCVERNRKRIEYFKELSKNIGSQPESENILYSQYEKLTSVPDDTVLACYLSPDSLQTEKRCCPDLIFPFGVNHSQKTAVENAFTSPISIVQGPPGTGKTQTILTILINALRNNKKVAVVSNNNSATHNVIEKLNKYGLSFLAAFLGNNANKETFIRNQSAAYPDMSTWVLPEAQKESLKATVQQLAAGVTALFAAQNRLAAIEKEFLELEPEKYYFDRFYEDITGPDRQQLGNLSARQILQLWLEIENAAACGSRPGLLKKIFIWFRFNRFAMNLLSAPVERAIPFLQSKYYQCKYQELEAEKNRLTEELRGGHFTEKMAELTKKSLQLFKAELAERYPWRQKRTVFIKEDLKKIPQEFTAEYPIILSTTHSIRNTLNRNFVYDYIIIDEASQVDLITGVLAFSCARNVVIVGDEKQLPNVLTREDIQTSNIISDKYHIDIPYWHSAHSLLTSAIEVWKDAPMVLLREHYRCHPKIINFCNHKFYNDELIVMTEDKKESDVLTIYQTVPGNHARQHLNQRQIDVVRQEILPSLKEKGYRSIGVIAPYREQVAAMHEQLGKDYEIDTVHKFQGREQDAIVITSVDNRIGSFVDDPNMLNVAVSRAVNSLSIVMSNDPANENTNYADLKKYITFNNFQVVDSKVRSIFDLLYAQYAQERSVFLQKHKKISEYDSENIAAVVITSVLRKTKFSNIWFSHHVSLMNFIKYTPELSSEELKYIGNPLTHVDFLLYSKMDKLPIMGIEVDGVSYHQEGSVQYDRDCMKDDIFEKSGLPLLRLRTDGSSEAERIESVLDSLLRQQ